MLERLRREENLNLTDLHQELQGRSHVDGWRKTPKTPQIMGSYGQALEPGEFDINANGVEGSEMVWQWRPHSCRKLGSLVSHSYCKLCVSTPKDFIYCTIILCVFLWGVRDFWNTNKGSEKVRSDLAWRLGVLGRVRIHHSLPWLPMQLALHTDEAVSCVPAPNPIYLNWHLDQCWNMHYQALKHAQ